MSAGDGMAAGHPGAMTILRAGEGMQHRDAPVATAPFLVQMLLCGRADADLSAMRACFGPGVISHWHSHPRGQLLHVLAGEGRVQREGGEVVQVQAGDTVWFAPGERHWHGATADSAFDYLSVQAVQDGSATNWFEPVDAVVGTVAVPD